MTVVAAQSALRIHVVRLHSADPCVRMAAASLVAKLQAYIAAHSK